jgi:predicted phosphate transport protein (TIGR00153 family)
MFSRLMPHEGKFFELFNAHADLIEQGGRELGALVAQLVAGSEDVTTSIQIIDQIESRADKVTHETVSLLHKSFNTPLDRDEIHKLITRMDDILDLTQDVAQSMYLYDVRQLTEEARYLSDICMATCERVKAAVVLLNNMHNSTIILKICEEIDKLESDADKAMRAGMAKLFREEQDVRQIIKLRTVYELLETITDACEDVANIIEGIVLENS